jgi:hypothetical protein
MKRIRNNCHVISVPFSKLNSMPPTLRSTAPVFRSESRNVYQEAHTFLGGYLVLLISSKGHSVNLNYGHNPWSNLAFVLCFLRCHFFIYTFQPLLPRHFVGHLSPPSSGLSNPTTFPIDPFRCMLLDVTLIGVFFIPWASYTLHTSCSVFSHRHRQSHSH